MVSRRLDTQQEPVVCAVCGRSLLRGEHANAFVDGTVTRQVCELCTTRAVHYGWVREGTETLRVGRPRERARSLVGRWRGRAEEPDAAAEGPPHQPQPPLSEEPLPAERRIHAVPTGSMQRAMRAAELFNQSEHTRTVAGVGRSLGPPLVAVLAPDHDPEVQIIVAWELCWYRYGVQLDDELHGVRLISQGDELADLGEAITAPNAAADERGELALVADAE